MSTAADTILSRIEAATTARRTELRDAIAAAERDSVTAQAAFRQRPQQHELLRREAARAAVELATDALRTLEAEVERRATAEWRARLADYAEHVAAVDGARFLATTEPELAAMLELESQLRSHVERIQTAVDEVHEHFVAARALAAELGIEPDDTPRPNLATAQHTLRTRIAARHTHRPPPGHELADWIRFF